MPPVAAAGAAIAGAVGTAATAAVGAISALTLAEGLMLTGTAVGLIGQAAGSKTLTKIGMGMSLAGGVTGLVKGNAAGTQTISGDNAKTTQLLDVDNMDDILGQNTKGAKTIDDFKTFTPTKPMTQSTDAFNNSAKLIGEGGMNEQSFLQRASNTLMKPDMMGNVLMGMGNAYMQTRGMQSQEDINKSRLDFEREQIDRRERNYGAPTSYAQPPGLRRVPNQYGLLRSR